MIQKARGGEKTGEERRGEERRREERRGEDLGITHQGHNHKKKVKLTCPLCHPLRSMKFRPQIL